MPAGTKAKKRQRQRRNRKRRQLLENSRRSRDDLINSALEETDVVAVTPCKLGTSVLLDVPLQDAPSIFCTPCSGGGDNRRRALFVNSTPRRRRSLTPSSAELRPPSSTAFLQLSPVLSVSDETDRSKSVLKVGRVSSTTGPKFDWWIECKVALVNFLNSVASFFSRLYLSVTSITLFEAKPKRYEDQDAISAKLDLILNCVSELSAKQDRFSERQESILVRLAAIEVRLASGAMVTPPNMQIKAAGGPPPPPPPPPPLPLLESFGTPEPLVIVKKSQSTNVETSKRPSRPSITLEDILNVQLKKTPAVKPFGERTPVKGQKGPLVSVDMLRSVKLKPASMRRQSLERPLQSPSTIFQDRPPSIDEEEKSN